MICRKCRGRFVGAKCPKCRIEPTTKTGRPQVRRPVAKKSYWTLRNIVGVAVLGIAVLVFVAIKAVRVMSGSEPEVVATATIEYKEHEIPGGAHFLGVLQTEVPSAVTFSVTAKDQPVVMAMKSFRADTLSDQEETDMKAAGIRVSKGSEQVRSYALSAKKKYVYAVFNENPGPAKVFVHVVLNKNVLGEPDLKDPPRAPAKVPQSDPADEMERKIVDRFRDFQSHSERFKASAGTDREAYQRMNAIKEEMTLLARQAGSKEEVIEAFILECVARHAPDVYKKLNVPRIPSDERDRMIADYAKETAILAERVKAGNEDPALVARMEDLGTKAEELAKRVVGNDQAKIRGHILQCLAKHHPEFYRKMFPPAK